ncbi:MAG: hypothetical protein F4Y00_11470 [Bacteroidetes bacterium SB0662_bin_6]|nr:hypothetical protein [Bacteroidetes bacterium SB0662_bin_6]
MKDTYRRNLQGFVALNALIFFVLFSGEDMITAIQLGQFEGLISLKALLGLVLPLVTLVLDGIVSADAKAILVYWRLRDPLPGSQAFTKHGPADPRVDMESLERVYGSFPAPANEQNQLWYRIFKAVEDQPSISQAHRTSLLTRDLANLSFALAPLGAILGAALRVGMLPWALLVAVLAVQYLVLRKVAVNSGRRFVTTVLAEAAASTD